jgi:hypothetical protein
VGIFIRMKKYTLFLVIAQQKKAGNADQTSHTPPAKEQSLTAVDLKSN